MMAPVGFSTMLAAGTGYLATTDDLVELCTEVKKYGGDLFFTHPQTRGNGRLRRR